MSVEYIFSIAGVFTVAQLWPVMASSGQFELQKQLEIPEEISSKNHRSLQFLLEILRKSWQPASGRRQRHIPQRHPKSSKTDSTSKTTCRWPHHIGNTIKSPLNWPHHIGNTIKSPFIVVKSPFSYIFLWFYSRNQCFPMIFSVFCCVFCWFSEQNNSGRSSPTALRPKGKWRSWRFRPRPQFSMRSNGFYNDFTGDFKWLPWCFAPLKNQPFTQLTLENCECSDRSFLLPIQTHPQTTLDAGSIRKRKWKNHHSLKYTCTSCTIADHQFFPDLDRFCPKHYLRHHFR